ncbi:MULTISPECIES: class I SAM-dependent methyltransferase [unclassified Sphingobium]|uniref:class I SAM-dependent methyltransferase n=1 Tax=unclassified Sphingobium TaxID=2611147 RepID=UPI00222518D1|nr:MULTISPECIES: methyltransferase domain-containing protein [unclassified Sphingobium]MCW2413379.1 phospholipid N-methyltransferase [Sphingobium sp. B8D3D]MCW2414322.1 phospholipid N-methyltransferase [Sphingobium sp. B8D3A]
MASTSQGGNDGSPHWTTFLKEFAKAPLSVGSPIATSTGTIERQLAGVDWAKTRLFVEYGPGTGEFTRYILAHLPRDAQLIAIESEDGLADHLRQTVEDPRLTVHTGSALQARAILGDDVVARVDYILSGLPFSALEKSDRARIVDDAARLLNDDGEFLAYQVRRTIEPSLRKVFTRVKRRRRWLNVPPYHLYWCREPKRSRPSNRVD